MSSKAAQRPSLVRRMAAMLWLAAALAYLVTLVSMVAGASYLIERNLDQQARQLLPAFDDLSAQVLLSPESSARERISNYAARIPDIGLVRIYDRGGQSVVAEYRKAGAPAFAPLGVQRTATLAVHGGTLTHVERFLGVGRSIQAFAPVRQVVQRSDLLDFGSAPQSETSETVGFIEIGMDFAPSRSSVYFGALATLGVLSLVLLAGMSAIIRHMRGALKPLLSLQDALARIAEGDFDASVGDGPADREVATIRDAIGTTIVALRAREAERNEAVRAKVLADEANLAKGSFLANMSHEIRTPMNGVIGMLELLLGTTLAPTQRQFASVAHSSAESLLSLINDILDFSKIEAGKLDFEAIPFDMLREIEAIAAGQALAARAKGLDLTINYPGHLPQFFIGDPCRIGQVVANLMSNAIKFTAQGRVLVDVQLAGQDAAASRLRISVRDTGIGLSGEQLNTIFDKFTQADASTTRRYGGTGLGLTICKLLVEMMGGTIGATSAPGKGSIFWVELDLARASGAPALPATGAGVGAALPGMAAPLAGYRILAVDDNPVNLQVVSHMLGRLGAEVDLAENGRVAVHMFLAKPYSLILMDCQMPELDGYQAVAEMRHLESSMMAAQASVAHARLPIIALTAHALEGEREKCLAAGMDDFLSKPLRAAALRDKLLAWLVPHENAAVPSEAEVAGDGIDAMRCMFGAKYEILVQLFLEDTPPRLAALDAALQARDTVRLADIAHTVAGSASALGAEGLASQCRVLEQAVRNGQVDAAAAQVAAMNAEFNNISARLQALFAPQL